MLSRELCLSEGEPRRGWHLVVVPRRGDRCALVAAAVLAAVLLNGCAGGEMAASAYEFYDAKFERSMVVGHDDQRGNYAEYKWSPRPRTDGKAVVR